MELTPLQLECQKLWADKSLSFGCVVYWYKRLWQLASDADFIESCEEWLFIHADWCLSWIAKWPCTDFKVIWHPIRYDRLCYLKSMKNIDVTNNEYRKTIMMTFVDNPKLYNQSILEWSDNVLILVRDFLLSIQ